VVAKYVHAAYTMNNILLFMILFVQLWNFRQGMFEMTVIRNTESTLRGEIDNLKIELEVLKKSLSCEAVDLK
jgi:hypothetical protein